MNMTTLPTLMRRAKASQQQHPNNDDNSDEEAQTTADEDNAKFSCVSWCCPWAAASGTRPRTLAKLFALYGLDQISKGCWRTSIRLGATLFVVDETPSLTLVAFAFAAMALTQAVASLLANSPLGTSAFNAVLVAMCVVGGAAVPATSEVHLLLIGLAGLGFDMAWVKIAIEDEAQTGALRPDSSEGEETAARRRQGAHDDVPGADELGAPSVFHRENELDASRSKHNTGGLGTTTTTTSSIDAFDWLTQHASAMESLGSFVGWPLCLLAYDAGRMPGVFRFLLFPAVVMNLMPLRAHFVFVRGTTGQAVDAKDGADFSENKKKKKKKKTWVFRRPGGPSFFAARKSPAAASRPSEEAKDAAHPADDDDDDDDDETAGRRDRREEAKDDERRRRPSSEATSDDVAANARRSHARGSEGGRRSDDGGASSYASSSSAERDSSKTRDGRYSEALVTLAAEHRTLKASAAVLCGARDLDAADLAWGTEGMQLRMTRRLLIAGFGCSVFGGVFTQMAPIYYLEVVDVNRGWLVATFMATEIVRVATGYLTRYGHEKLNLSFASQLVALYFMTSRPRETPQLAVLAFHVVVDVAYAIERRAFVRLHHVYAPRGVPYKHVVALAEVGQKLTKTAGSFAGPLAYGASRTAPLVGLFVIVVAVALYVANAHAAVATETIVSAIQTFGPNVAAKRANRGDHRNGGAGDVRSRDGRPGLHTDQSTATLMRNVIQIYGLIHEAGAEDLEWEGAAWATTYGEERPTSQPARDKIAKRMRRQATNMSLGVARLSGGGHGAATTRSTMSSYFSERLTIFGGGHGDPTTRTSRSSRRAMRQAFSEPAGIVLSDDDDDDDERDGHPPHRAAAHPPKQPDRPRASWASSASSHGRRSSSASSRRGANVGSHRGEDDDAADADAAAPPKDPKDMRRAVTFRSDVVEAGATKQEEDDVAGE